MKAYQHILFDLDGTLVDSKQGIIQGLSYALAQFELDVPSQSLEHLIGPPLSEIFKQIRPDFFSDPNSLQQAITYYRDYYANVGIAQTHLYPGISQLLPLLCDQNKRLIVATSKPTPYAEAILQNANVDNYFIEIIGSNMDGSRSAKTDIIAYVLSHLNIPPHAAVMVGDRYHDIVGAQTNKIDSIGVSYGYGTLDELEKFRPNQIVHTIEELTNLLST